MKFNDLKMVIGRTAGRTGLILKKHSPEILMTVGIVGVVTSTVMACKATLKCDEVLDNAKGKLDKIKEAKEKFSKASEEGVDAVEYTEKDYKKDLTIVYVQTGVDFIKLYGPAFTLGMLSLGCILGAHGIMRKRNIALMAAYKAIEQNFNNYRNRVIEEFGEEKDRQYRTGVHVIPKGSTIIDQDGNQKKSKEEVITVDPNGVSVYAKFFDEACMNWSKSPEYNLMFLKGQQNWANDLLHSRGHIFLNEVYDMLGIPRTQAGAVVGWVKGVGDDFVDFGLIDPDDMSKRDFINGYERSILLDFNVAGVIYDLI